MQAVHDAACEWPLLEDANLVLDEGAPLAVWGSGGRLEISGRNGNAAGTLGLARGDRVLARLG